MKHYNREHCDNMVRATIKRGNQIITLSGRHAFEWSISQKIDGKLIITTYPNGSIARKEFEKLKSRK